MFVKIYKIFTQQCVTKYGFCSRIKADISPENKDKTGISKGEFIMKKNWKKIMLPAVIAVCILLVAAAIIFFLSRAFVGMEGKVRSAWRVDAGELLGKDETNEVEVCHAALESDLTVLQLVPFEVEEEGFTYYDEGVQERLFASLESMKNSRAGQWKAQTPLTFLNPFGTAANGLYFYFETDMATQVSYTIHVEDPSISDFTRTAREAGGESYTKKHEFQMIGLVPGYTNHVTMTMRGKWGNVRQKVSFMIEMPKTHSGYPTRLSYTDGQSVSELSDGLYVLMRTNGYLGYGFFFDNEGIMRYEMVLEGFGLDRILFSDGDMITCVSSRKLAKISPLGMAERVYPLGEYELHHDICFGPEGTVLALVNKDGSETIEDVVIEVDLNTGAVSELIDYSVLMSDYCRSETYPVPLTSEFFWQAGKWDWLHINTLQYLEESDSLIISSRETSAVIKTEKVHSEPEVAWLLGDPAFWEGTAYEDRCLAPEGDFVFQYGQHSVEYAGAGNEQGVYYLSLFNNNYWANSSRDYEPVLDDSVCRSLYGSEEDRSQVYIYKVDENSGTFSLEKSFPVPYSSIVSNAALSGNDGNWVVNSGVANVFGEYDAEGALIRQFDYDCTMQGYRTFKHDFKEFWFQ